MNDIVLQLIKKTPLYIPLRSLLAKWLYYKWEQEGKPLPPPNVVKQKVLREYAKKYGIRILVETGTLYGDMIEAMKIDFDRIFSVELCTKLYERAMIRFRRENKIELINGNSGHELQKIMNKLCQPALFWLDGHYSGEMTERGDMATPIYDELQHIFDARDMGHVIIIDDARCFESDPEYPPIEQLFTFIKSRRPDVTICVQDDIIRITPNSRK